MRLSGLFGLLLLAMILGGDIVLAQDPFAFAYLPAFLVTAFGALGLSYLAYGAMDTLAALRGIVWLVRSPGQNEDLRPVHRVLAGSVLHLYACGAAGSFIGLIKMLHYVGHARDAGWHASPVLVSLLPLFYALLLAEFLVRPAARRIGGLLRD